MTVEERKEMYNESNNGVSFEIPQTPEEIIQEGRIMHNALALGIWNKDHMNDKKTVVLVKVNGESTFDMLVVDGELVHAVGRQNAQLTPDEYEMVTAWARRKGLTVTKSTNAMWHSY